MKAESRRHAKRAGFTITEALVAVSIIAIVAAILVPVLHSARRSARIGASISNMRQLYLAMQLYRDENDGVDGVYDFYALALPTALYLDTVWHDKDRALWPSPCGYDGRVAWPPLARYPGEITYVAAWYDPTTSMALSMPELREYLRTYRHNAVVFLDFFCNDSRPDLATLADPYQEKRAVAVLLSGEVVNRRKKGVLRPLGLGFYSSPPP